MAVASSDSNTFWRSLIDSESFAGLYYVIIRLFPHCGKANRGCAHFGCLRGTDRVHPLFPRQTTVRVSDRRRGGPVVQRRLLLHPLCAGGTGVFAGPVARHFATWSLVRAVEQPTWPRWLGFGVISALAVYAHFFAVLVLVGKLGSLLLHRSLVPWQKVAAATGLSLLVLPLAAVLLSTNAGGRPKLPQTSLTVLPRELAGIVPTRFGVLQAAVFALCGVGVVAVYVRQRQQNHDPVLRGATRCSSAGWDSDRPRRAHLTDVAGLRDPVLHRVLPALYCSWRWASASSGRLCRQWRCSSCSWSEPKASASITRRTTRKARTGEALVQHVALEAQGGDRVVFLSHFGRRPFEYYLDRHPGLASSLTPAYPSMPWGNYPP